MPSQPRPGQPTQGQQILHTYAILRRPTACAEGWREDGDEQWVLRQSPWCFLAGTNAGNTDEDDDALAQAEAAVLAAAAALAAAREEEDRAREAAA